MSMRMRSASGCSPTATSRRRAGRDVAVVNGCCVTNEAVAKSRKAAARAARSHTPGLSDRLRRQPRRPDRSAGLPANVTVVARRPEETAAFVAGERRGDRLRPGRRPARPRARVRQDPGRLLVLVPLLRDPARARRLAEPEPPPRCSREVRRRVEQGHREVVLTGINLGCFRDRAAGFDLPRLVREVGRDPRARAAAAELDRDQPRRRRARRRAAGDADGGAAPARAAPVRRRRRPARDGPPLHGRDLPAAARAARRRVQPDERRDRRLPGRGRARVRAHARAPSRRPGSRGCTSSRTRRGRAPRRPPPTPCPPADEEGARRAAARASRTSSSAAAGRRRSARTTSSSSTGRAAATATTTRRSSSTHRSASSCASAARAVTEEGILGLAA